MMDNSASTKWYPRLFRRLPGLHHSPSGGTAAPSLLVSKRLTSPFFVGKRLTLALLALLAAGMLSLLPGGPLHAQDSSTIDYAENGTGPVATYTAVDPEGTAIRWSLAGTDMDDFSITGGVLRFKSTPNYEAPADQGEMNTYEIMVVATDSDAQTDEMDVTVTVTNVDEAGTLTLSTLQPVDGIELTTTLTDIDVIEGAVKADDTTWKWAKSSSRTGAYTVIEGETDDLYTPKPADVNHYLRATATYTDPQGSGKTAVATTANKVLVPRSTNTPPVFKDADGVEIADDTVITRDVAENTPKGGAVGATVAATDSEGDVLTYTLGGRDGSLFSIDVATGQLRTSAALDTEMTPEYMVTVTATDPYVKADAASSDVITVTINVTNVNEAPKLTGPASARVAENTPIDTDTTDSPDSPAWPPTYTATDDEDDNNNVVLSLSGTDAAAFDLNEGEVTFKAVPNFEAPKDAGKNNVYNITVVATDSDGQTDEMDVIVTVTNENELGTVTLSLLQPRIGTPLTATLTDMDGPVSDVKWKWASSDAMDGASITPIERATSDSYTPVADDVGKYLRAMATYNDPHGSDKMAMSVPTETGFMAVEIDDTNRAPTFPDQDDKMDGEQTDQEREIAENADPMMPIGVPVVATDPNMDSLTYSLGGTDGASFSIARDTGQLQTKASLNREVQDTHMVTVTATDPSGLSATVNVTINITNVGEPPVITRAPEANVAPEFASDMTSRTVAENTVAGQDIGTPVAASDANRDALTYALSGTDAASFDIDMGSGQLMTLAALDYETKATYSVTVTASDSGGLSDSIDVTITVTNEDEMGRVTFWRGGADATTAAIMVGDELGGAVDDSDGNPGDTFPIAMYTRIANVTSWQWARSMDMTDWEVIGTDGMYTVIDDDAGYYLRATAMYTDGHGPEKTAIGRSESAVTDVDEADRTRDAIRLEIEQAILDALLSAGIDDAERSAIEQLILEFALTPSS